MKVIMLVQTTWNGPRNPGDGLDVPRDVADRWIENNIAAAVEPPKRLAKRDDQEGGAE